MFQKKDIDSLMARVEAVENSYSISQSELNSDIELLKRGRANIDKQLDLLKDERKLVATRMEAIDSQMAEMHTSVVRQRQRIGQLESDNKRLANHNQQLLAQLRQKIDNSVEQSVGSHAVGGRPHSGRTLPAQMDLSVGSIHIAEPDTVIISGGVKNGRTLKTVTAVKQDFSSVELEELPVPLKHHCSVVYAGQVFVIGGETDGGYPRNSVYMLLTGRSWRTAASMIYSR